MSRPTKSAGNRDQIITEAEPFGRGWKIAAIAVVAVVVIAIAVMAWILIAH